MFIKHIFISFLLGLASLSMANKYALVVGHNLGNEDTTPLRYGQADASRFAQVLQELAGFLKDDIHLLLAPTPKQLKEKLTQLKTQIAKTNSDEADMFLLYYSGHADGNGLQLSSESYSFELLKSELNNIPTKVRIGIFDACQSGVLTRSKGAKAGRPFYLENQDPVEGTILIASSSASEQAQESESLKSSIFSHHWLNGLRGSADFSEDGAVTLSEAYQYAYRKTVETTALLGGKIQHPTYEFKIQGRGEIILTQMNKAPQGVMLTEPMEGAHLLLSQDYSDILADFHKKQGSNMFIPLKEGDYVLIQSDGSQAKFYQFTLGPKEKKNIYNENLKLSPSDWTRLKGSRPELEQKIEKIGKPLSRWSVGGALGTSGIVNQEELSEKLNLHFQAAGGYYVNKEFDVKAWLDYLYPENKMRFIWGLSTGYDNFYFDLGLGLGFFTKNFGDKNKIFPGIATALGYTISLNSSFDLNLGLTSNLDLRDEIAVAVGVQVNLMYLGKFRNIYTLAY